MDKNMEYTNKVSIPYKWIVFDLDGALLNDEWMIDQKNVNIIRNLTWLSIHIIFATGRWPKSTDSIVREYGFFYNETYYVVNYNWSLVRKIGKNGEMEILKEYTVEGCREILDIILNDSFLKDQLITKNQWTSFYTDLDAYWMTLVFNKECFVDWVLHFSIYKRIVQIVNENFPDQLSVLYAWKTIDILSKNANKESAVSFLEHYLGSGKWNFARVWDSWNEWWNDYSMLSNSNWFTVSEWDGAAHIFSQNGTRQYGQRAVSQLISDIRLTAWITIHPSALADQSFFQEQLSKYEKIWKQVQERYRQETRDLNDFILGKNLLELDHDMVEIDRLFSFNGAIKLSKSEVEKSECSKIKKYLIEYGGEYYWRWRIFYFFESFIKDYKDYEIVDINHLNDILKYFFSTFRTIIDDYENLYSHQDWKSRISLLEYKVALIIQDTLKSYIVKLLNILSFWKVVWVNISDRDLDDIKQIMENSMHEYYSTLEMNQPYKKINVHSLKSLMDTVEWVILAGKYDAKVDFKTYNRIIRWAPDACHPYVNCIYWRMASRSLQNKIDPLDSVILVGSHYGWIELPYVLWYFLAQKWYSVWKYVWVHVSKYENARIDEKVRTLYDISNMEPLIFNKNLVVCDDWIFSWSTLSDIWLRLAKDGPKNIFYSTLSFPCNRMVEKYTIAWAPEDDFLNRLYENWLTSVLPVYKTPTRQPWLLFNMKEQRVMNILSKWSNVEH